MLDSIRHRTRPAAKSATTAPVASDLSLKVVYRDPSTLVASERNARTHSKKQIQQLAASIRQLGFNSPVLVDGGGKILAGHGRVEAAKKLQLNSIPTIALEHLSAAEKRAFMLADNRLAEKADWDMELLKIELAELSTLNLDFEIEVTGFDTGEIDIIVDGAAKPEQKADPADQIPAPSTAPTVSRLGDLWLLDGHRLLCADALDPASFERLMDGRQAQMVITDPPYNVPIDGHVGNSGRVRHTEFVMASGEMSSAEFSSFLGKVMGNLTAISQDGAIQYYFGDWRMVGQVLTAAQTAGLEQKNLCVWTKTNGGMGTFYRSQHELCFVFKTGTAPHINNFGLGEKGRYRTNVWTYAGVNTFKAGRMNELSAHPTVKPVAMIADAMRDCSKRGGVVVDAFVGSGTLFIAAEKTKRIGYGLELDPKYVDVAIRRWQAWTGGTARLAATGQTFAEVVAERLGESATAI